ncbi:hypothetical protein SRABI06_03128 [Pseudomonas brassicacearum]|nr:hypothetical protein SRABI06_03128 [Pseudomonas brassicacearum]
MSFCMHQGPSVGASLLAIAVVQLMEMLTVPPSSRAGSLPQGSGCFEIVFVLSFSTDEILPWNTYR